jgi:hypothetical protein
MVTCGREERLTLAGILLAVLLLCVVYPISQKELADSPTSRGAQAQESPRGLDPQFSGLSQVYFPPRRSDIEALLIREHKDVNKALARLNHVDDALLRLSREAERQVTTQLFLNFKQCYTPGDSCANVDELQ